MSFFGDLLLGETADFKFTTRQISGAPFTLAGSPVISAYPANSTTQLTAGITLSVDFDSVTGLNNVRVVASSGNGYAIATNYALVITTGTVNSVSVVGEVIGHFSIENRAIKDGGIRRATFTADTGLQSLKSGTAQAGAATTITLDTGASSVDNYYTDQSVLLTGGTGAGQYAPRITGYVGSTRVATVSITWATNPDSTTQFAIFPGGGVAQTGDAYVRLGAPAGASVSADIAVIKGYTDDIGAAGAGLTAVPWNAAWDAETQSEVQDALDAMLADSLPADGTRPSFAQAVYALYLILTEKSVSGTTVTVKKVDGSTTAMTFTINSAITPTSITRTT